ncbi:Enamine/imine deaminase [bacterium YEK0313]|nr:Enamine/imine deaminase [bacterium YEK0313]
MQRQVINAENAPAAVGGYAQAVAVSGATRTLYVSGQIPVDAEGRCPEGFAEQCRLAWRNVLAQLAAADMTVENLAKVTIFLSDRRFAQENRAIRAEMLGSHQPALTVIITGIFDEAWLLEIEAVAVA